MKWTEELIESELKKCIEILMLDRMPTAEELKMLGRNDLHIKVSRTKRYSGWAEYLGLPLKSCHTRTGQKFEGVVETILKKNGHTVERMTTKHPFDLLVNRCVKVDVKVAKPYLLRGSRVHTFGLAKRFASCDIYICLALDEKGEAERIFVIPSHFLKIVTLCVGKESIYNEFIGQWHYIRDYTNFMYGL